MRVGGQVKAEALRNFPPSQLPAFGSTEVQEVPMLRISERTVKNVIYGIAVTITWLLTTVYYLLAASQ